MPKWDSETAEWYAKNYGEYPTNRLAVDALDLPANGVIVDVGCGTGAALRHAAVNAGRGRLIGIDPVPRMIEIARERLEGHPAAARIEFREGGAENLPVENDQADLVFAFDAIDHWRDVDQGLREVRRILRPRGQLVIVKDQGVPGVDEALQRLVAALDRGGFEFVEAREIAGDDVTFTLWRCIERGA